MSSIQELPTHIDPPAGRERAGRLLMVTARYYPFMGGVQTHVYEVAPRLVRMGWDVTVLSTDSTRELPPEEHINGVRLLRVPSFPRDADYYFAPQLHTVIACGTWDLIHLQGCHTLVAPTAMAAARSRGVPYLVTFHTGGHSSPWRNRIRNLQWTVLGPLLRRAEHLVAVSRFEATFFQARLRLPAARFTVIPNGAQFPTGGEHLAAAVGEPTTIVAVGRLESYKGHQRAIAALPHVLRRKPDIRLRILGTGPYESELRQLAARLGVATHVEITSIPAADRRGMAQSLTNAALVMLLSDYEAHPIAVMEALALGRPVLVTDTSGLHELAEDGLVRAVPLDSSPSQTADAILEQLERPLMPAAVKLPTWEQAVQVLDTIYRRILRDTPCEY